MIRATSDVFPMLALVSFGALAQDDEPTMRAIPDPAAAAQAHREEFGRSHEPDALPDQVPTDVPPASDHAPPNLPTPPAGG